MKRLIIISAVVIMMSGCVKQETSQNTAKIESVPAETNKNAAGDAIATGQVMLKSPMEILLETGLIIQNNPEEAYPNTDIKLTTDPQKGTLTARITNDGLPDDVLKKQVHDVVMERDMNGQWGIISQKLLSEECWPGRNCD